MAAMPANSDTVTFAPFRHSGPERIHHAGHCMARNARTGDSRPAAFDDDRIAVAHTTCLNFDGHISRAWIGNLELDEFSCSFSFVMHLPTEPGRNDVMTTAGQEMNNWTKVSPIPWYGSANNMRLELRQQSDKGESPTRSRWIRKIGSRRRKPLAWVAPEADVIRT